MFASQRRLPAAVLAAQRARRLRQRPEGLAACLACLGLAEMPSTWDALTRFAGDLHWIVGGADKKFIYLARQVVEQRPATRLTVLDGIGHNPLLESPLTLRELLLQALPC